MITVLICQECIFVDFRTRVGTCVALKLVRRSISNLQENSINARKIRAQTVLVSMDQVVYKVNFESLSNVSSDGVQRSIVLHRLRLGPTMW